MLRNSKFLNRDNWSLISRGWIFEAVVPHVDRRPLHFFVPDEEDPYRGTCVALEKDFIENKVHQVVLNLKRRKVVILSNDELNTDPTHTDVQIAKIYSISEEERSEPWYEPTVQGTHPFFIYLPEHVTGKECLIDISTVTTIHKSLLLEEKIDISNFMPQIEAKLSYCLDLGMFKEEKEEVSDIG